MTEMDMSPASVIVLTAIEVLPDVIRNIKELFKKRAPDEPEPTDEEVIDALNDAFASSLAQDDAWLAAHPDTE